MGLESNSAGDSPRIAPTAFVHPTATVLGNVSVEARAFIGPYAVLRADEPGPDGSVQPIVCDRRQQSLQAPARARYPILSAGTAYDLQTLARAFLSSF